jgi:hypothetical protein
LEKGNVRQTGFVPQSPAHSITQDEFNGVTPLMVPALLAAHRILPFPERVLHLDRGLFGPAFSFQLLVAEDFPAVSFTVSLATP